MNEGLPNVFIEPTGTETCSPMVLLYPKYAMKLPFCKSSKHSRIGMITGIAVGVLTGGLTGTGGVTGALIGVLTGGVIGIAVGGVTGVATGDATG